MHWFRQTKPGGSVPSRRRRLLRWGVWSLLGYTVLGFLVLPPIVRRVAQKRLTQELGREVSIENIRINPYVLSATVRGFLIKEKDGAPFVAWDEVYVNLQLSSLFGRAWVFKEITTSRPYGHLVVNKDFSLNCSD